MFILSLGTVTSALWGIFKAQEACFYRLSLRFFPEMWGTALNNAGAGQLCDLKKGGTAFFQPRDRSRGATGAALSYVPWSCKGTGDRFREKRPEDGRGDQRGLLFYESCLNQSVFPQMKNRLRTRRRNLRKTKRVYSGCTESGNPSFRIKKGFGQKSRNPCIYWCRKVGIEPTRTQGPGDFESPASTYFTTPAKISGSYMPKKRGFVNVFSRMARFNWIFQGLDEFGLTRFYPLLKCGPLGLWRPL